MMARAGIVRPSRAARRACKNKDKSPETETRPDRAGRLRRAKALPKQAWEGLPPYVQACAANRHRKRPYFLYVWNPDNPNKKTRIDYFCRSWRCPYCRHHESHVLYSRVREAFEPFNAADIVFFVLTLDPREHQRGKTELTQVYREFTRRGANLLKRVRRWMTKHGMKPFGSEWVSTIEAHKSGVPHINYMVHSPELAAFFRADAESRRVAGESSVESIIIRGELRQHLEACGFGWRSTAEAVRLHGDAVNGVSKLAGYITKIAGNTEKTHGELAKLSQVPLMAPKNFRRLRSGKKFLPKRRKGDGTGALLRRYPSREGDEAPKRSRAVPTRSTWLMCALA